MLKDGGLAHYLKLGPVGVEVLSWGFAGILEVAWENMCAYETVRFLGVPFSDFECFYIKLYKVVR